MTTDSPPLPPAAAVTEALARLGVQIKTARKRRRWTQGDLAKRTDVSVPTIRALEAGRPTVSLGVYVAALWALNLHHTLSALAHPREDADGLTYDLAALGRRVRHPRPDDDF